MSSITIMTLQGRAQLAAAVANAQSFPSAKIAVGDGNGATYVPNEAQVGLVHEVWRGNATVARTDDRVIFQAVVPAEVGGFTVREVGVLIGEIGAEQLFIISQHPSTEKIAAPANGSGPLPVTIAFSASAAEQAVLPIGSSDNATLQLSRAPHITVDGLVTEPPAEPVDGALYAIDTGAAGLFVGKGGWLVERVAGAWIYKQPPEKSVIRLAADGSWAQRNGADWVALTFEDTSILWEQIADPPSEFPPEEHNHDDRYFTEAETLVLLADKSDNDHLHDGRYVLKAGDTMTGTLDIAVASGENALRYYAAGSAQYAWQPISATGYTLRLYRSAGTPGNHVDFIADGSTRLYGAAQIDGNLALGSITPTAKLDVNGDTCLRGNIVSAATNGYRLIAANPDASKTAGAYYQAFGSTHASLPGTHIFGSSGTDWLTLTGAGAVKFNGDAGTSSKVLVGNASGPPTWQLPSALWGKKIIAIGTANSGDTITFATAEPDTSYSGVVLNGVGANSASNASTLGFGSLSSKGTGSCVVNSGSTSGAPGMTATNPVFYIIYR